MTVCPIAIVSGCAKCPIFKVCPVKGVIGDYMPPSEKKAASATKAKSAAKPKPTSATKPAAKKKT